MENETWLEDVSGEVKSPRDEQIEETRKWVARNIDLKTVQQVNALAENMASAKVFGHGRCAKCLKHARLTHDGLCSECQRQKEVPPEDLYRLCQECKRIIDKVAKPYLTLDVIVDIEDLRSEAFRALITTLIKYKLCETVKFTTVYVWYLKKSFTKLCRIDSKSAVIESRTGRKKVVPYQDYQKIKKSLPKTVQNRSKIVNNVVSLDTLFYFDDQAAMDVGIRSGDDLNIEAMIDTKRAFIKWIGAERYARIDSLPDAERMRVVGRLFEDFIEKNTEEYKYGRLATAGS